MADLVTEQAPNYFRSKMSKLDRVLDFLAPVAIGAIFVVMAVKLSPTDDVVISEEVGIVDITEKYTEVCLGGFVYWKHNSSLPVVTPKYADENRTLVKCD